MPLPNASRFAALLGAAFAATTALTTPAALAEDAAKMQLLFVGAAPDAGLDGAPTATLPVIAIDALPEADAVRQEVFAARLRANPVSTFVSTPSDEGKQFDQFFLVAEAALQAGGDGFRLAIGDDAFTMEDFAGRLGSAVQAFDPRHRRIGFLHLTDEADRFPAALPALQSALTSLDFDMMVLMIAGQPAAGCPGGQPLHYSVVSGLSDRAPFGDGDGISTVAEVESYLTAALSRVKDRGCGPDYSLILKASDDPAAEVVTHAGAPEIEPMETRLYHETFEAMFLLTSEETEPMQAFLTDCVFCPNEDALQERLQAMRDAARTRELEAAIWARIRNDASGERLAIYLENCTLCEYREEASAQISMIDVKMAAAREEEAAFLAASEARDLAALRAYFETCVTCAYLPETEGLIAEIEADSAYQAERALLAEAVRLQSPERLETYLKSCTVCDGEAEVTEALALIEDLKTYRTPCLTQAGLPQHGGPRKLEDIDQTKALLVCRTAAEKFPDDGLLATTLGRISQAAGDTAAAMKAYEFGMEREVPAAFGLAAYNYFSPADGGAPDVDQVDSLATKGAEMGDWLSHEILTVVYSKGLVPGKTGEDAFDAAMAVAQEGNALAQFFVGYYYLTGTGTEISEALAEDWLKKSVDQGYTHAYSFLAELHERGGDLRAPQPDRAAELYWSALEQGDPTATDRLTTQLTDRDREVVRLIQERLREAGLYRGPVDGVPGRGTANAIREYAESLNGAGADGNG